MNRFCERCQRTTLDGNLWCPEVDCPAEERFPVLHYGDFLGDLKITKLVRVWRTAAWYEALRGNDKVMVKVAHESEDSEERIKREAAAFQSFHHRGWSPFGFLAAFTPSERPLLPELLPPYPVPAKRPYGEISFRGHTKFYSVFKPVEGKFLSDLMLENPQMWHYDAAWITITLAEALRPMAVQNRCHLCLTPDMIVVDVDAEGHPRATLLDLGLIVAGEEIQSIYDWPHLVEPAYTPPELLDGSRVKAVAPSADAYALGMMYYEMLSGKPGFEHELRRDDQIRSAVMQNRGGLSIGRPELELAGVIKAVDHAVSPTSRYNNVVELGSALAAIYGQPPREKRPWPVKGMLAIPLVIALSLVSIGIVAYFLIQLLPRLLGTH
jgi:serine/threonine protein kinase